MIEPAGISLPSSSSPLVRSVMVLIAPPSTAKSYSPFASLFTPLVPPITPIVFSLPLLSAGHATENSLRCRLRGLDHAPLFGRLPAKGPRVSLQFKLRMPHASGPDSVHRARGGRPGLSYGLLRKVHLRLLARRRNVTAKAAKAARRP